MKLKRQVAVILTGGEMPDGWKFASTALAGSDRVFHIDLCKVDHPHAGGEFCIPADPAGRTVLQSG